MRLVNCCRGNLPYMEEPVAEIAQKRARRAKWFFTVQIGGVVVVMALLAIVAVANISKGEDTAAWVALLIAEPVVLAGLLWLARRAVKEPSDKSLCGHLTIRGKCGRSRRTALRAAVPASDPFHRLPKSLLTLVELRVRRKFGVEGEQKPAVAVLVADHGILDLTAR